MAILLVASTSVLKAQAPTWSQLNKLTATNRGASDQFGYAVAISDDYMIVGSNQNDSDENGLNPISNAGAAYVYHYSGGTWVLQQKLVASDRANSDAFGSTVAISGNYAIIGAFVADSIANGLQIMSDVGAAYVFYNNNGTWVQQQKLVASDRTAGDNFSKSVSISGDYAVIGASGQDSSDTGAPYSSGAGAAYIFKRTGATWEQQQKLVASDRADGDAFGWSASISGDDLIIGAYYQDSSAVGQPVLNNAGAAYVFTRNGTTWSEQQKLVAADRAGLDYFGCSVAISGNDAIIGAYGQDSSLTGTPVKSSAGAVYYFSRSGTTWAQQQKLVASDRTGGDYFGFSVSISGNSFVAGAYGQDSSATGTPVRSSAGAAYTFIRNGATWSQQQKIVAADRKASDFFGYAVQIFNNNIVVAAPLNDSNATNTSYVQDAGAVYIFNGGVPLAIRLTDIKAQNQGASNLISWNTASEDKGDLMTLERSTDGVRFAIIAAVNAKGKAAQYRHTDAQPLAGLNYYRLRFAGANGKETMSQTVTAYVKGSLALKAYPNPPAICCTWMCMAMKTAPFMQHW